MTPVKTPESDKPARSPAPPVNIIAIYADGSVLVWRGPEVERDVYLTLSARKVFDGELLSFVKLLFHHRPHG